MTIIPSFQLKEHNTLALEAVAAYLIDIPTEEDATLLSKDEYFRSIPFVFMGGGSNLLFAGDFKGAVVHFSGTDTKVVREDDEELLLQVGAGHSWHSLVLHTAEKGLWGIENLALIPGEVGAAAVQNIGAYGRELADVLDAVHTVDLKTGEPHTWLPSECHYGYRHSIFKEEGMEQLLVTAVELRLSKSKKPCLEYAGLKELKGKETLTPLEVAQEVIRIRKNKLPDPKELPNAGSFFMNPFVGEEQFFNLIAQHPNMPHYKGATGYKIPAAWLIEQAGLKGYKNGKVGTYEKQPLVIVNYGNAEPNEVIALAEEIQRKVNDKFGISLKPEVRYVRSAELRSINHL